MDHAIQMNVFKDGEKEAQMCYSLAVGQIENY